MKQYNSVLWYVLKIIFFFFVICVVDFLAGFLFNSMLNKAPYGNFGRLNYINNKSTDDILIFGSSRAVHHYNPQILEDSLGGTCYNCGMDGNGILQMYANYKMLSNRHKPKIIIYEVTPSYDIEKNDNSRFLGWLKPLSSNKNVADLISDIDHSETEKLISNLYKWNLKFVQLTTDNVAQFKQENKGYKPLLGNIDKISIEEGCKRLKLNDKQNVDDVDTLKLHYLENLICDCNNNGTDLIFFVSPSYCAEETNVFDPVMNLSIKYKVPFFYHYRDISFFDKSEFFSDKTHLNEKGANEYTKLVARELKSFYNK